MRLPAIPVCLAALALAGLVSTAAATVPASFEVSAVDAYIAETVAGKNITGLSVAILKDGRTALAKGYGCRSLEPRQPVADDTRFSIGSVTKQFVCACILLLAEEGKLAVRDSVAKYYPQLTRAGDITLLDLMNHVSGYPDYYPLDFVDRRMAVPIAEDDLIAQYGGGQLDFAPGARYSYSNTGYAILGRVIEKASGEPLGTFLERRVLRPLAMGQTAYEPRQKTADYALGYTSFALGPVEPAPPEGRGWAVAAGGIFSTTGDLARWDQALMDGRLFKPESWQLMTARRQLADGRWSDYGCGLGLSVRNGLTVLAHSGAMSGFRAFNTLIPARRSAVILLSNCEEDAALQDLNKTLVALLLPKAEPPPRIAGPAALEAARDFLGRMQRGTLDHTRLGAEFSHFLTPEKVSGAAARLKPLGSPVKSELANTSERGGMEVSVTRFTFKDCTLRALMYRTPDGKIQEYLVVKE